MHNFGIIILFSSNSVSTQPCPRLSVSATEHQPTAWLSCANCASLPERTETSRHILAKLTSAVPFHLSSPAP